MVVADLLRRQRRLDPAGSQLGRGELGPLYRRRRQYENRGGAHYRKCPALKG